MTRNKSVKVHPQHQIEQNLSTQTSNASPAPAEGFAVYSTSGFAVYSTSGFAVYSTSGFAVY